MNIITDEYVRDQCRAVSGIRLNRLETKLWAWFGEALGLLALAPKKGTMEHYYNGLAIGRMGAANSLTFGAIHKSGLWFEFSFEGGSPHIIPMYDDKHIKWVQIAMFGDAYVCVITGAS